MTSYGEDGRLVSEFPALRRRMRRKNIARQRLHAARGGDLGILRRAGRGFASSFHKAFTSGVVFEAVMTLCEGFLQMQKPPCIDACARPLEKDNVQLMNARQRRAEKVAELRIIFHNGLI